MAATTNENAIASALPPELYPSDMLFAALPPLPTAPNIVITNATSTAVQ